MAEIYKSKFPGQEIDERLELIPELQEGVEAAQQAADGKYTKPASGIPMTDLSDEVREAIEEGGGQADWAQTDTTAPDYIKNKPSIPTHVVRFVQQFLSDSERMQARANIGAGTYTKPSGGIPESDLADDVVPDVSDFITNTVNNLVNYYLKSETYSRSEVQQLIAAIQGVSFVSVASLPTPSADTMGGKIYLVPSANPDEQNVKDEFITIQDGNTYTWEQIGSTAVNLSGYVTTQQLNNALAAYTTTEALTTLLAAKQDTISDLSTIRSGAAAGATAYQKPQTGIPASDLAPGVIPTVPTDVVKYSSQSLSDAQKTQARTNIGAAAAAALTALETAIAAKYTKPSSGIPETDLAANVQSALALARTSIQSLADYYDKTEIDSLLAAVSSEQYVDVATLPTASASTLGKIYLVGPDANNQYARYYTSYDGSAYSWVAAGTTEINLALYATKEELSQLSQELADTDTYSLSDLTNGKFYTLTGSTAPASATSLSGWYCNRFPVKAGMKAILTTKGGANGRAYALTNEKRIILSRADANATLVDYELQVEQDGFIYVNAHSAGGAADFSLKLISEKIPILESRVSALEDRREYTLPAFQNNPFPITSDTLRVLILGNSFTEDSTMYLGELLTASGIDKSKLCVYSTVMSGATIDQWIAEIENNTEKTLSRRGGTMVMTTSGTMQVLLAQAWDVIVITQASDKSYTWSTYANMLKYVSLLRLHCPNQKVCIAFQMPWGHTEASTPTELAGNIDCIMDMAGKYGVDYIIPTGMAIQNARGTSLNTASYLTRDNWHLCYGVGRYVAACSFYQSIIAPVFNVGIVGNSAVHALTPTEAEDTTSVAVTSENNTLCQMCAFAATIDMFNVTANLN